MYTDMICIEVMAVMLALASVVLSIVDCRFAYKVVGRFKVDALCHYRSPKPRLK